MNNAEVLIKFTGDAKEVKQATQEVEGSLDDLSSKGKLAFLGLTAAADAFAVSILSSGVEYNAQIETYMTRLETLTGSAEEAENVLNQIKEDALKTPFDVSSLTQAESLLLSTGLSAEDARGDILALGDAIAASGGGNAELQRMAVNLQQIKNVGKASALDIKQFAYAGIDIYGLLADYMGVTREEAAQLDVTYDMLSGALQGAASEGGKYYGAMEKQSQTYNGQMSNLKESLDVLKGELSKELFNAFKKIIPKITDFFDWLKKNEKIVKAIAAPTLAFANALAVLMIVKKVSGAIKVFNATLAANPIILIVAAIAALVAAFIYLWNNCEAFRNFWIGLWNSIKQVVETIIGVIKVVLETIITVVKNIIDRIMEIVRPIIDFIIICNEILIGIITALIDAIINVIIPIVQWIWNNVLNPVINFFTNAFTTIWNTITNIFNKIRDTISAVINWIKDHIITPLIGFFSGIFSTIADNIGSAFKSASDVISGIFDTLVDIVKAPLNLIIDAINVVIDALNSISIKVPNWVPKIGGKKFGFNIPHIPPLEVGTNYVPEDMLAVIHEGEAVVPKKFNPYANQNNSLLGRMNMPMKQTIIVNANFKQNSLGQTVRDIKTFSGGARNDYNYGM